MPTDNFNRANGALGSNWTNNTWHANDGVISSNMAAFDGTGSDSYYYWNADAFADDQYSEITFGGSAPGDDTHGVLVRHSTSDTQGPCYTATYADYLGGYVRIGKHTPAGGPAGLAEVGNAGSYSGGVLRLEVTTVGGNARLELFYNTVSILVHTDSSSPILSGSAGIVILARNGAIDSWGGGDLGAAPAGQPTSKRHGGVPHMALPGRGNVWAPVMKQNMLIGPSSPMMRKAA